MKMNTCTTTMLVLLSGAALAKPNTADHPSWILLKICQGKGDGECTLGFEHSVRKNLQDFQTYITRSSNDNGWWYCADEKTHAVTGSITWHESKQFYDGKEMIQNFRDVKVQATKPTFDDACQKFLEYWYGYLGYKWGDDQVHDPDSPCYSMPTMEKFLTFQERNPGPLEGENATIKFGSHTQTIPREENGFNDAMGALHYTKGVDKHFHKLYADKMKASSETASTENKEPHRLVTLKPRPTARTGKLDFRKELEARLGKRSSTTPRSRFRSKRKPNPLRKIDEVSLNDALKVWYDKKCKSDSNSKKKKKCKTDPRIPYPVKLEELRECAATKYSLKVKITGTENITKSKFPGHCLKILSKMKEAETRRRRLASKNAHPVFKRLLRKLQHE